MRASPKSRATRTGRALERARRRATRRATRPGRAATTDANGDEVFVFGLGYLGRALAEALTREGYVVRGTTLDDADDDARDGGAATTTTWRGTRDDVEAIEAAVDGATYVISAVPPTRAATGEGWIDPVYDAFATRLSAAREDGAGRRRTRFVGYCSTTAVYGDRGGGWVDETSALRASEGTAKTRRDAEERWRALAAAANGELKVVAYRLGGIYGPGRSALETARRRANGERESESQRARASRAYTSRVHVRDAVNLIAATMRAGEAASDAYNVVDDFPMSRRDAVAFAERLMGVSCDGASEASAAPSARGESSRGEKRVKNDRMKRALERFGGERKRLEFPSAYQGLRELAVDEGIVQRDDAFAKWFDERFSKLLAGEYADVRFVQRDDDGADASLSGDDARELPRRENGEPSRWFCEFS